MEELINWHCDACGKVYFSHSEDVEYNNAFDAWKDSEFTNHVKTCYRPLKGRHGLIVKSKTLRLNKKTGLLNRKVYLPFRIMKIYLTDFYWNSWVATTQLMEDRDLPSYEFSKVFAAMQYLRKF